MNIREFLLAANALTVKNLPILGNYLGAQIEEGLLAGDTASMRRQLAVLAGKVRANETFNEFLLRVLSDEETIEPDFVEPITLLKDALDNPDDPPLAARVTLQRLADQFHSFEQLRLWSDAEFARFNQELARTAARVDRVEATLAAAAAPRRLSEEQLATIVDRMKPWAGQRVMWFIRGGRESINLANAIRSALTQAGLVQEDRWGLGGMYRDGMLEHPGVEGVVIFWAPEATPSVKDAGDGLATCLHNFGLSVAAGAQNNEAFARQTDTLFVAVGPKPPSGRACL